MNIAPLERYDTVVNFLVQDPTAQAEVKKAARRLLEDAAMELGEASATAIALTLMQIYKNGYVPGNSSNAVINELSHILAEAGRKQNDSAAHDSY